MKLLLDTCTFLWVVTAAPDLSDAARSAFRSPDNQVFLSAASVWEITVKHALGRLPLPDVPAVLVPRWRRDHGIDSLPMGEDAVLQLASLPPLHGDPFDRMLVGQAIAGGLAILTPDRLIAQYPVRTVW